MPTIFEWKGWKFLFYSLDGHEPPHVHVRKDRKEVKIWLESLAVAKNRRCSDQDISAILKVVTRNRDAFVERWHEYFGD
ncbi:DUF4160 domain-containing protein [Stappia stellulata]|uniref:DUF4160 domain-containing protein n=1 Tax=Stappia stellulata TaxID=71235 RepID=UPI001CD2F9AD|nr:DUF4160 domain-containing protein [Stappia stellulata]MCA1241268.1 DUF4160 domain-containing protein [Stappia stellulata]